VKARGFTLLEVLIALAILGVAVVASIQGFAQGLRLLKLAGDHQDAMMVADQKMREVVVPTEGDEEGTETRFRWKRTIARVPTALSDTAQPMTSAVYQIDVHVQWDERREIHLATLRTISNVATVQTGTETQPGPQTTQPGPQTTQPGPQTPPTRPAPPTRSTPSSPRSRPAP
jgi:type II secretion system protein I